jgi:hypothetical protein
VKWRHRHIARLALARVDERRLLRAARGNAKGGEARPKSTPNG